MDFISYSFELACWRNWQICKIRKGISQVVLDEIYNTEDEMF